MELKLNQNILGEQDISLLLMPWLIDADAMAHWVARSSAAMILVWDKHACVFHGEGLTLPVPSQSIYERKNVFS